jgi:AcrR family transcriptional regulator
MADSEARERVLKAAERLFINQGYSAVKVRDIADEADIHQSSIYHHLPRNQGKEALYVEVMTRFLEKHRDEMNAAIQDAGDGLTQQLYAASEWLLSQPPLDMARMVNVDFPSFERDTEEFLKKLSYSAIMQPVENALIDAQQRGEVKNENPGLIAGALVASIQAVHTLSVKQLCDQQEMARQLVDIFIRGIEVRQ